MKICNVQYKPNFKGVYALVGTREQIKEATSSLVFSRGESLVLPASSIYRNEKIQSPFCEFVKEGSSISFVVTGHGDVNKISGHAEGWRTLEDISKQIDKYIILKDIKQQMREIKRSMTK